MKIITFLIQTGIVLAGAYASAASVESAMSGFNLKACSANHAECLELKAQQTEGSKMKMLHSLVKPEVAITSHGKTQIIKADSGYIDLEENQLVLYKKDKGHLSEISINLTNFEKFTSEMSASL